MEDNGNGARAARSGRAAYVAAIALGSFLLFLVQPMIARMALPRLGGSPAVWNSAMLVYQTLLLAGYAYAHATRRLPPRWQVAVHAVLFATAAAWLPVGLSDRLPSATADPVLWTPLLIATSIGPLFLVVASQAPLLQRWHAAGGGDPYPLYAASNLGSFAGLLAYPLLLEPFAGVQTQRMVWSIGYVALALATGVAAWRMKKAAPADMQAPTPAPSAATYARWIVLAAVPSALMLSTTTYLTTDIVATPLLWVLPLGIYLLTFVAAFSGRDHLVEAAMRVAPVLLFVSGGLALSMGGRIPAVSISLGLMTLYAVGVALHGSMHRMRPASDHLTGFYLAMSAGGVIGGICCALIAPVVFDWVWEHPLLLISAGLLFAHRPLMVDAGRRRLAPLVLAIAGMCTLTAFVHGGDGIAVATVVVAAAGIVSIAIVGDRWVTTACLVSLMVLEGSSAVLAGHGIDARFRSYFGSYRIVETDDVRIILSGTTMHGMQRIGSRRSDEMLSYYGPTSGVATGIRSANVIYGSGMRVGVIGLGAGTLACLARPGQDWSFYEIDPDVVRVARDPRYFTYLADCAPHATMIVGDARLKLEAAATGSRDVLVLDAFSSDAIPMHLVTSEAFDGYARVVGPNGMILVHISNRHLDLEPVMAAMPGWRASVLVDAPRRQFEQRSTWVLMTRDGMVERRIRAGDRRWRDAVARPGFRHWTDSRSSILPLLRL